MNRNVESHFSQLPSIDIERSIFDRSSTVKTTFNAGELIPFYVDEVLPGDTFRVTTSKVIRAQTMLTPIMDNMYLDTYFFYVPNRLIWNHWEEFMGANNSSAWAPSVEYQIPSISSPLDSNSEPIGFDTGTIADYMGLPVGVAWTNDAELRPSALPFRAYAKVCEDWFRAETVSDPLNIPTSDSNQTGSNGASYINDVANGGKPFLVSKYHDYYTSALPAPQRIDTPVGFDFAQTLSVADKVPVGSLPITHTFSDDDPGGITFKNYTIAANDLLTIYSPGSSNVAFSTGASFNSDNEITYSDAHYWWRPTNLWADLNGAISLSGDGSFTINELRLAFQLQKWYEKMARAGGGRYIEILKAHFSVTSPDARLQRSEYLGGNRIPLNIHEVTNSAQSQSDFLGDLGAKCATSDIHEDFEKSFVEHGYVIGVMCVRYDHSYPQGFEKFWMRRKFTDFYWPVFANIGEQPLWDAELYADATTIATKSVFGYQEAYSDYRFKPDRVTGEMRPGIQNTLASWHLADYYTEKPTLSDSWMREDKTNVDRCLAVTSAVSNQFFCDIYIENIATRPMPMYSIPGLIDHH